MKEEKAYTVDELAELLGKLIGIADGTERPPELMPEPRCFREDAVRAGLGDKSFYDVAEVAQVLGCSTRDLYGYAADGRIKAMRPRGTRKALKFRPVWVDEFVRESEVGGEIHAA